MEFTEWFLSISFGFSPNSTDWWSTKTLSMWNIQVAHKNSDCTGRWWIPTFKTGILKKANELHRRASNSVSWSLLFRNAMITTFPQELNSHERTLSIFIWLNTRLCFALLCEIPLFWNLNGLLTGCEIFSFSEAKVSWQAQFPIDLVVILIRFKGFPFLSTDALRCLSHLCQIRCNLRQLTEPTNMTPFWRVGFFSLVISLPRLTSGWPTSSTRTTPTTNLVILVPSINCWSDPCILARLSGQPWSSVIFLIPWSLSEITWAFFLMIG